MSLSIETVSSAKLALPSTTRSANASPMLSMPVIRRSPILVSKSNADSASSAKLSLKLKASSLAAVSFSVICSTESD